ncbi:MAG: diacylglycerol kinase [Gammaproteobacteria bacterium]|nr:diacylglycerol kinase [Gammaproteobacteria bacterium]
MNDKAAINKPTANGLRHIWQAFGYSRLGLAAAYRYEASFRIELFFGLILLPFAIWLGESGSERALLVLPLFAVLMVELLNSALETLVDRVSIEQHPLSGRAKDIGSAACFVAQMSVVVVWALVLLPRFF